MPKIIAEHANLGSVTQSQLENGFSFLSINHINCQAKLSLYGGQVLSWQPIGEKEVFWLSNDAIYQTGKAIRGGIPLCWPWFGPLEGTGQHGFARQVHWHLDEVNITEQGVTVTISWQGQEMDEQWPYQVKISQTLFFSNVFEQTLQMINLTAEPIKYTGALHSYFAVSSPEFVTVPGLNNSEFDDKLTGQRVQPFSRKNCIGPIDTVYHNNQTQQLIDQNWQRVINVETTNTQQWVLWNPGKETADKMADVHNGGENEYVCLEAANTQWQTITGNSSTAMSQKISIKKL